MDVRGPLEAAGVKLHTTDPPSACIADRASKPAHMPTRRRYPPSQSSRPFLTYEDIRRLLELRREQLGSLPEWPVEKLEYEAEGSFRPASRWRANEDRSLAQWGVRSPASTADLLPQAPKLEFLFGWDLSIPDEEAGENLAFGLTFFDSKVVPLGHERAWVLLVLAGVRACLG